MFCLNDNFLNNCSRYRVIIFVLYNVFFYKFFSSRLNGRAGFHLCGKLNSALGGFIIEMPLYLFMHNIRQ